MKMLIGIGVIIAIIIGAFVVMGGGNIGSTSDQPVKKVPKVEIKNAEVRANGPANEYCVTFFMNGLRGQQDPANVTVNIELLDASGNVIASQQEFINDPLYQMNSCPIIIVKNVKEVPTSVRVTEV